MLGRLVEFSLHNRLVVLTLAAILFGVGLFATARAPLDVFPEFAPPQVTVETEAPGLNALEVESLVTRRLELAVNGTPGIKRLRSTSMPGVSSLTAIFEDDTDVYRDRQLVAERLATVARDLPQQVVPPELVPQTSASSTVEVIAVTGKHGFDPLAARTYADWVLKPRILAVPGISKVVVYGGRVAQMQVVTHPDALRSYNLSMEDIDSAAAGSTAVGPAGAIETQGQRLPIRILAQARSASDLASAIVGFRSNTPLRLSQVANVRIGPQFPIGDASLNGEPAVVLLVARQPGVNTLQVTDELDSALIQLARHTPENLVLHRNLFRQATFIRAAIGNLRSALIVGGVLVVAVLLIFLADMRSAVISLIAIPLSLLTAVVVLRSFGATLNTMTLGGLAIALGEVVDDSIIDVENIRRRLELNRLRESPLPGHRVILEASLEVRSAVVYATFLVALVFLPVFFLSGVAGKLFSPLAIAYVLATLASLLVALLVTPAACSVLLKAGVGRRETSMVSKLKQWYRWILEHTLRHPRFLLASAVTLFVVALAGAPLLAGEFLPTFNESDFIVHMVGIPGTALQASVRAGREVEKRLLKIPGVQSVAQRAGRAELADEVAGPESSELDVRLAGRVKNVDETIDAIRRSLVDFPGFSFAVSQFLSERIEEVAGGEVAPVAVAVSGPDLDRLQALAERVEQIMTSMPQAQDIRMQSVSRVPQIVITFDRARAAQLGVSMANLQSDVSTAFAGKTVGELYEGERILPVVVKFPESSRRDPEAIRDLPIRTASGVIRLADVARVEVQDLPNAVTRQDNSRRVVVTCSSTGGVASFTRRLRTRLNSIPLPPEYSIDISGDYANEMRGVRELVLVGVISLIGIFLLLITDFRSARLATLVLVNLPLALIGGIGAALLLHVELSLGAVVGFVTLFGITARNAIMLISHFRHLEREEGLAFGRELVLQGAVDRLTPILMTAMVTGLALLPLVVGGARAGQEIEHPMAVVIVGGLISSTLLNLLLMPAFYLRWSHRRPSTD